MNRCDRCGSSIDVVSPSGSQQPIQVVIQTVSGAPGVSAPVAKGPPVGVAVKSKIAAGLFGILLGALGIHRFYLGYTGIGITQLLFTVVLGVPTCGLSVFAAAIWGLVEGILILAGTIDRDAQNRPLKD